MQFIPALAEFGIDVETAPLLRDEYLERFYSGKPRAVGQVLMDYLHRLSWLLRSKHFDLVWIEKELFPDLPGWFEYWFRFFGVRYVVDYDDAIFHNYDLSTNPLRRLLNGKIDAVMRGSAIAVCGNTYLAGRAVSAGAARVEVVPTVVDLARYSVRRSGSAEKIVVGWVGSPSTVKYLDAVIPALRVLSKTYPVQLRVIGAMFSAPGIDVDCRSWSEDDEVHQIQQCDIGIMPLFDSPWERGKCGYKLIQYMACGIPIVASPVGVNEVIVEDGSNGYLAKDQEAWTIALERLCIDPGRRRVFGSRGRQMVEDQYCLQVVAPRLASLLKESIGNP